MKTLLLLSCLWLYSCSGGPSPVGPAGENPGTTTAKFCLTTNAEFPADTVVLGCAVITSDGAPWLEPAAGAKLFRAGQDSACPKSPCMLGSEWVASDSAMSISFKITELSRLESYTENRVFVTVEFSVEHFIK